MNNSIIYFTINLLGKHGYNMKPNKDGSFCGPCPFCGEGTDRFTVFNNNGTWGNTCCCRKCPPNENGKLKSYNTVDLLMHLEGMSKEEAVEKVRSLPLNSSDNIIEYRIQDKTLSDYPTLLYFLRTLVKEAKQYLNSDKGVVAFNWLLHSRHLKEKTIASLQLGYFPSDMFVPEKILGFPNKGYKVLVPKGVVIPGKDEDGNIVSVDIRRLDGTQPSHYVIRGSKRKPEILEGDSRAIILVESLLDGALIWQEAKDLCSVGVLYSAQAKATETFARVLKSYPIIIYAGDTDKAGAIGFAYWRQEFNARRWLIPSDYGKDPCEAADRGLNIREWVTTCLSGYPILYPELFEDRCRQIYELQTETIVPSISNISVTTTPKTVADESVNPTISIFCDENIDSVCSDTETDVKFTVVNTEEGLTSDVSILKEFDRLALDTETYSDAMPKDEKDIPALDPRRNKVRLIILTTPDNQTFIFDMKKLGKPDVLIQLIHSKHIVGHNLKFDFESMVVDFGLGVLPKSCFDNMIAEKLIYNATETGKAIKGTYKLSTLCSDYFNIELDKEEQSSDWSKDELTSSQLIYATKDTMYLFKLQEEQMKVLEELGFSSDVVDTEMRFIPCLSKIELAGIPVDTAGIDAGYQQLCQEYEESEHQWQEQHGGVNPNSPKQLMQLFEANNLNLTDTSKTTLAKYSDNPIVASLISLRSLKHPIDYLKKTRELEDSDKIFPVFQQVAAPTGRMSSSGLNVQAIPSCIKGLYACPPTGYSIVKCDYPAIELRIAAVVTQEPNLIECFQSGQDPHSMMAAKIKGTTVEEIGKDSIDRKKAKAANFGFLYGMGAGTFKEYAMSYGVKFTQEEAEEFKAEYLEHYPEIDTWQKDTGKALRESESGAIEKVSLAGRVMLADTYCSALNYAVQGTGADMIKKSVVKIDEEFTALNLEARIINVVHDDIRVLCPNDEVEKVKEILVRVMGSVADNLLPKFKTVPEPEVITSE